MGILSWMVGHNHFDISCVISFLLLEMIGRSLNRNTLQYVLVALLVIGIGMLVLRNVQEGFQNKVVDISGNAGSIIKITKEQFPKDATKLKKIELYGLNKDTKQFDLMAHPEAIGGTAQTMTTFFYNAPNQLDIFSAEAMSKVSAGIRNKNAKEGRILPITITPAVSSISVKNTQPNLLKTTADTKITAPSFTGKISSELPNLRARFIFE